MDQSMISSLRHLSASTGIEQQAKCIIAASEAKIARIEAQIRDLLCMRDQERGLIAALRFITAPIRTLPAELLTEIFLRAVGPWGSVRDVLRISQVSAYWRQIAHRTPALWTMELAINVAKSHSAEYLTATKVFLERSAPLSIPINLGRPCYGQDKKISPALIDVLLSVAPRWTTLEVWGHPSVLHALVGLAPDALKQRRTVNLNHGAPREHYPAPAAFVAAPRLRRVTLDVKDQTHKFRMPWAQLTHLSLTDSRPQICLDILVQCTNLTYAKIDTSGDDALPSTVGITVATLSQLETFELRLAANDIAPCVRRLSLPKLKRLEISQSSDWDGPQWSSSTSAAFSQFQLGSPNIEHFSLGSCELDSEQLRDILLRAPSLTQLVLDFCQYCIDDLLLEALTYSEDHAVHLAPRLQELVLHSVGDEFNEETLTGMIRSRWWSEEDLLALSAPPPVVPWKRIDFWRGDYHPALSASFQADIAQLRSQGLDVEVK